MSAGGKVKAFSQVVDHYVQRCTLNRFITKGVRDNDTNLFRSFQF